MSASDPKYTILVTQCQCTRMSTECNGLIVSFNLLVCKALVLVHTHVLSIDVALVVVSNLVSSTSTAVAGSWHSYSAMVSRPAIISPTSVWQYTAIVPWIE